jgi:hypothetical protein
MSVILVILSTTFYYLEMKPHIISYIKKIRWSSFLFTSFGEATKLLSAPYVFMISPRVAGKNDLAGVF